MSRLGGPGTGRYAALFLVLLYGGAGFWNTAQPDGWAAFILLLAFAPLLSSAPTDSAAAYLAGAACGIAALYKPLFGAFLLVPLLYVCSEPTSGPRRLRQAALVGLSCAVPLGVCAAWFAAHGALGHPGGHLHQLQPGAGRFPATLAVSAGQRFLWRLSVMRVVPPALIAGAVGIAAVFRSDRRAAILLLVWLGLGFWSVWTQHRFWSLYQWHVAFIPLAVVAWVGVGRIWHAPLVGPFGVGLRLGRRGARTAAACARCPLVRSRDELRWLDWSAAG